MLTPTPEDTFKLLYGRAFRAPNLYEMFHASQDASVPNPELRPEIVDTYEAVWERQWKDGWRGTLDAYLWTMVDSMGNVEEADGAVQIRNVGFSRAYGLEAEIEKKWKSGARLRAYATGTRAEAGGEGLEHSAAWITGLSAAIAVINRRTFLAVEPQIVGPQKPDIGAHTEPTFITNVVLTSRDFMTKGLEAQLGVYNLFGEYAHMPHSDAATHVEPTLDYPHTQFIVSLKYKF